MSVESVIDKLYPIFEHFGWTWHDSDVPPTRDEFKKTISELTDFDFVAGSSETGRILVTREEGDPTYQVYLNVGRIE